MMFEMLADWLEKFKSKEPVIIISLITILGFSLGFGLGRLSKIEEGKIPIKITGNTGTTTETSQEPIPEQKAEAGGKLVASKNGKKYYLPWCGGAERIKPENLISFVSSAEARARGYTPAANCPGLE